MRAAIVSCSGNLSFPKSNFLLASSRSSRKNALIQTARIGSMFCTMNDMKSMLSRARFKTFSVLIATLAILGAAAPVQAAFHLWTITEVYSDATGSLQFIELVDNAGFQGS